MDQEIPTVLDPTPQIAEAVEQPVVPKRSLRRQPQPRTEPRKVYIRRDSQTEGGRMVVKERPKAQESLNTEALLNTLRSFRKGDFSVRMSGKRGGIAGEVASTLNDIIDMN